MVLQGAFDDKGEIHAIATVATPWAPTSNTASSLDPTKRILRVTGYYIHQCKILLFSWAAHALPFAIASLCLNQPVHIAPAPSAG